MNKSCERKIGKVAYLAPEIPALSATFVYNEILALEQLGFEVVPISVHKPKAQVNDNYKINELAQKSIYLYQKSFFQFLVASLWCFLRKPVVFIKALGNMLSDIIKVGLFTRTSAGLVYRFIASASVAQILNQRQCKHLHIHFAHIPTDIGMYAAALAEIPYSFTSHANDIFQRGWLLKEKIERARFCVTISEYNKHFLTEMGARNDSINVIHCGVDTTTFGLISTNNEINNKKLVIGTLGRAVEKKGFDVLLSAVSLLKTRGIPVQLILAGDGPLLDLLKKEAERLNIVNNVIFSGAIAHDKVADWLQQLDTFVLPCKKDKNGDMDGIPVVLMEAMMVGIPVVSTRITGIPELVIDNKTGILAKPDDPDSLAHAILSLYNNNDLRHDIIENAVMLVREQFDLRKNAEHLAELILGKSK